MGKCEKGADAGMLSKHKTRSAGGQRTLLGSFDIYNPRERLTNRHRRNEFLPSSGFERVEEADLGEVKDAQTGRDVVQGEHCQDRDGVSGRRVPLRPDVPGLPQQRRHRRVDGETDFDGGKAEGTR